MLLTFYTNNNNNNNCSSPARLRLLRRCSECRGKHLLSRAVAQLSCSLVLLRRRRYRVPHTVEGMSVLRMLAVLAVLAVTSAQVFNATLTPCGQKGSLGPNTTQCQAAYQGQPWLPYFGGLGAPPTATAPNAWQTINLPQAGAWTITAAGAAAQNYSKPGFGRGAIITYSAYFPANTTLFVMVGQMGIAAPGGDGGGGGGTFVLLQNGTVLVVGAGGGGATSYTNAYNPLQCLAGTTAGGVDMNVTVTDGSLNSTSGNTGSGCGVPGFGTKALPGGVNGAAGQGYGAGGGLLGNGTCSTSALAGGIGSASQGGFGGGSGTHSACGNLTGSGGGAGGGYSGGGGISADVNQYFGGGGSYCASGAAGNPTACAVGLNGGQGYAIIVIVTASPPPAPPSSVSPPLPPGGHYPPPHPPGILPPPGGGASSPPDNDVPLNLLIPTLVIGVSALLLFFAAGCVTYKLRGIAGRKQVTEDVQMSPR